MLLDLVLLIVWRRWRSLKTPQTYQIPMHNSPRFYKTLTIEDISMLSPNVYEYIRDNLEKIILYQDIDGVTKLTRDAFERGEINMFDCHTLAHMIGHHAAAWNHFNHIDLHVSDENVNFCGGGFMHGVEDGIATYERLGFREELYKFCNLVLPKAKAYGACYHGAGHAFMKKVQDPKRALAICDTLIISNHITSIACYRGVFSEYMDTLKKEGKRNVSLLVFCASLPQKLHQSCALELNGFGITPESTDSQIEQNLRDCINNEYNMDIKVACLESVSWAATDSILARQNRIIPPDFIFSLPTKLQQTYMFATASEIKKQLKNGSQKDWSSFCNSFPDKDNQISCNKYILN